MNHLGAEPLRAIYRGVGSSAYPPELLLKMILWELLEGRNSPAQWHRDASMHDALKWLGRGIQPSRTAWYDFRDRMDKVIDDLNDRIIRQAVKDHLARPEQAAQDGTTFRSNASRHQTFNQTRLSKRRAIVQAVVEQGVPSQAVPEPLPKWIPPTVDGRLQLLKRIHIAQQQLDRLLRENAGKMPSKRRDEKNIVVSLTDPEAPFARDKEKTFCFLYTSQFMVDSDSLLVLGYSLAAENTDAGTIGPLIDRVQKSVGGTLKQVSADAGYSSILDLQDCFERGIDLLAPVSENSFSENRRTQNNSPQRFDRDQFQWLESERTFRCPAGHQLDYKTKERLPRHGGRHVISRHYQCAPRHCLACPLAAQCTTNPARGRKVKRTDGQELVDAQQKKMQQADVKEIYRRRGQTIERAFADAKSHRSFGKFHGRGLSRSRAEVGMLVMAQNVLTLHRLKTKAKHTEKQTK